MNKITISITIDKKVLNDVNEKISNRSKFIEKLILEEISKNKDIKKELKNKKIIL